MNWNPILILGWAWIVGLPVFFVLLLYRDPNHLPRFLQNLQSLLADDLVRLFKSAPFFETARSLFEASLFAGPTYLWCRAVDQQPTHACHGSSLAG